MRVSLGKNVTVSIAILTSIVLVAAGVVGTLLVTQPQVPDSLEAGESPATAPVTSQEFADSRTVQITLDLTDPVPITSNVSGLVTSDVCEPGLAITSGTSMVSVDGVAVVMLATSIPLWRDLEPGAHGDDVMSLQTELQRLGYDIEADGYYYWATRQAVGAMLNAAGSDLSSDGVLHLADIMWLPEPSSTVNTCEARVGSELAAGSGVATLPATLESISIANVPTDLQPGARHLDFGEFTVPTDANSRVTDAAALETVTGSSLYPSLLSEAAADGTSVAWLLDDALPVITVPPQALYDQESNVACVQDGVGTAFAVTIVSASLGQSLVTMNAGATAPERVALNPDKDVSCS